MSATRDCGRPAAQRSSTSKPTSSTLHSKMSIAAMASVRPSGELRGAAGDSVVWFMTRQGTRRSVGGAMKTASVLRCVRGLAEDFDQLRAAAFRLPRFDDLDEGFLDALHVAGREHSRLVGAALHLVVPELRHGVVERLAAGLRVGQAAVLQERGLRGFGQPFE